jgi:TalC/MipB family fructose-6-phosphate aldolase
MFLDTAHVQDIKEAIKTPVFQGVTTNPTILLKEGKKREAQIEEIFAAGVKILYVQLLGSTEEELYEDYKKLSALKVPGEIRFKISMDFAGLCAVKRIKEENKEANILGTAIYSADQAILASIAGCDSVAPYVNRMQNNGIDPFDAIRRMRNFIEERNLSTIIVAASFKNTQQILDALDHGAHTATIPYDLFQAMIGKDLATQAIAVFNDHGKMLEGK